MTEGHGVTSSRTAAPLTQRQTDRQTETDSRTHDMQSTAFIDSRCPSTAAVTDGDYWHILVQRQVAAAADHTEVFTGDHLHM